MAGSSSPKGTLVRTFVSIAIGAVGSLVAWQLGFPAPFITGPAIAVTLAGLTGVPTAMDENVRNIAFILIGLIMGSGVTPDSIQALRNTPVSFLLLLTALLAIILFSKLALQRFFDYRPSTAVLASSPGHLSYVLSLSLMKGGDTPAIAVAQSTRVLILTLAVPFSLAFAGMLPPDPPPPGPSMPVPVLVVSAALALMLGFIFLRINLPAAFLMGGMVVSTVAHAANIVEGQVPQYLSIPAFTILGTLIGSRFSGAKVGEIGKAFLAGIVITVISGAVAIAAGFAAAEVTGLPLRDLLISFAPGGLETMAALALVLDCDPAFVAAHHVTRLLLLSVIVPVWLSRLKS